MTQKLSTKTYNQKIKDRDEARDEIHQAEVKQFKKMTNFEDNTKGDIAIKNYEDNSLYLGDHSLSAVLDDVILVRFVDIDDSSGEVMKGGILLPGNVGVGVKSRTWRKGIVVLAGPNCQHLKQDDIIVFPGDKGMTAANISVYRDGKHQNQKHCIFLNECRTFGVCVPKE